MIAWSDPDITDLAKLAGSLGIDADPHRAIARFRIASHSKSEYDHLWHQDSIDPLPTSKGQRTLNLGYWIPLHDVGTDDGTLEFSLGSHFKPIPHTETEPFGRLFFPIERVRTYKKRVVPVSFGNMLALDPWVTHQTFPNKSCK